MPAVRWMMCRLPRDKTSEDDHSRRPDQGVSVRLRSITLSPRHQRQRPVSPDILNGKKAEVIEKQQHAGNDQDQREERSRRRGKFICHLPNTLLNLPSR